MVQGSLPIHAFRRPIQYRGSSFSGWFTRVDIGHILIGSVASPNHNKPNLITHPDEDGGHAVAMPAIRAAVP
jgi:hypothetical protein